MATVGDFRPVGAHITGADGQLEASPLALDRPTLAALTLAGLPGIGDRGFRLAVDHFGSADAALRSPAALQHLMLRAKVDAPTQAAAAAAARQLWERGSESGLRLWIYGQATYPTRLNALHDPPALLWGRGDSTVLSRAPVCAVVGSRRAGRYGLRMARSLGHTLSSAGIVVVSGMAMGIDAGAHQGALAGAGGTVAVLGSGADVPTPASQKASYHQIVRSGLVLSEFPPGSGAAPHNFPRRNRIIAALADAVVVVEAAARSGALITVDHALDLGVSVFAVPGPMDSARCAGSNALLADGAAVVLSPQSLVDSVFELADPAGSVLARQPRRAEPKGALSSAVWELLAEGPLDVDELTLQLGEPASVVMGTLGRMELDGWVESEPGARYARSAHS